MYLRAKNLDHAYFSLRPRPFCVLGAVGQEFVGCSYEKRTVSLKQSMLYSYLLMKFHMMAHAKSIFFEVQQWLKMGGGLCPPSNFWGAEAPPPPPPPPASYASAVDRFRHVTFEASGKENHLAEVQD